MSKGDVWGGCCVVANSGEVNPEPGGGERQKEAGHLVVKNEWFEGCCDAGDVIDGASSASRGAQEAIERAQIVVLRLGLALLSD